MMMICLRAFGLVNGVSEFVNLPFSFDVLSGLTSILTMFMILHLWI